MQDERWMNERTVSLSFRMWCGTGSGPRDGWCSGHSSGYDLQQTSDHFSLHSLTQQYKERCPTQSSAALWLWSFSELWVIKLPHILFKCTQGERQIATLACKAKKTPAAVKRTLSVLAGDKKRKKRADKRKDSWGVFKRFWKHERCMLITTARQAFLIYVD